MMLYLMKCITHTIVCVVVVNVHYSVLLHSGVHI